jgi:hypothetical protein
MLDPCRRLRLHVRVVGYSLAALLVVPCAAAAQASPPAMAPTCRDQAARFAVGRPYSARLAERARRAARATVTRTLAPGQVYTMEFLAHRLNFEIDRRGIVRRVRCG